MYVHDTLSSSRTIRILKLHPAQRFDTRLEVELQQVDLDAAVPSQWQYEALSYHWGARTGTVALACHNEALLVTPNCEAALRHLRTSDSLRVLWVDAVCINQENSRRGIEERNSQVPLMGEIYSKAKRTICWLGEGTSFSGGVMRLLHKIGTCPSQRGLAKLMKFEEDLRSRQVIDSDSSCLDHIFCHPWHSRIWTVQEVAFSSECQMMCGDASMPWSEYTAAAEFLIYEEFIGSLDLQAAKSMVSIDMRNVLRDHIFRDRESTPTSDESDDDVEDSEDRRVVFLTSCLTDVNHLQATDPKDKIYGLYAVYARLGISLPAADYNKTRSQVYTEAAVAMILWSGRLMVLHDACSTGREGTLPSWVPDWNDAQTRLFMPDANATNFSRLVYKTKEALSPVPNKLRTRGRTIGSVVSIAPNLDTMPFPTWESSTNIPILADAQLDSVEDVDFLCLLVDKIRFFRELRLLLQKHKWMCSGDEKADVFYDICSLGENKLNRGLFDAWAHILEYPDGPFNLFAGRIMSDAWKAADVANAEQWTPELSACATIAAALISNSVREDHRLLSTQPEILDLVKEISENLADQSIIAVQHGGTRHKILGTTFQAAAIGDVAVLLEGADWPVVLRAVSTEYIFVGPAFLRGVMDGEAWTPESGLDEFLLV